MMKMKEIKKITIFKDEDIFESLERLAFILSELGIILKKEYEDSEVVDFSIKKAELL